MKTPATPANEPDRLDALRKLRILDSAPEPDLDKITSTVASLLGVPIALISLVDKDRQWFKSRVGLEATETPRDISFCGHAVADEAVLVVEDTMLDDRFADNPLVTGDPKIRFYAGVLLYSEDGYALGTLCAIGREPRKLSDEERELLEALASCVEDFFRVHRRLSEVSEDQEQLVKLVAMSLHDLKNPLMGILAGGQILHSWGARNAEEGELVEDIVVAAGQMQRILLDTLDLALSQRAELPLNIRPCDLAEVTRACGRPARQLLRQRGQLLSMHGAEERVLFDADRTVVVRAVGNLLLNASRFSPKGATIVLRTTVDAAAVSFIVEDTGPGIPAGMHEKIFEAFRTESSDAHYGLGLAFCRLAARAHGGAITAADRDEGGARFQIRLPR